MLDEELLEFLARETGCMYISDLRYTVNIKQLYRHIKRLRYDSRSLKEWRDAVQYLTGYDISPQSSKEAKAFLLKALLTENCKYYLKNT